LPHNTLLNKFGGTGTANFFISPLECRIGAASVFLLNALAEFLDVIIVAGLSLNATVGFDSLVGTKMPNVERLRCETDYGTKRKCAK